MATAMDNCHFLLIIHSAYLISHTPSCASSAAVIAVSDLKHNSFSYPNLN
jgi:hypothetical protein